MTEFPSVINCEDCQFFQWCDEIDVLPEWYKEKRPLGCDVRWDRPTQSYWRGDNKGTQPFTIGKKQDLDN